MTIGTDQSLDLLGYWWLPAHAEHRVPGRLIWSTKGGGRLHLLGELRPVITKDNVLGDGSIQQYRERRTRLENEFSVIHGEANQRAYTLLNSFSLNGVGFSGTEEHPENVAVNGVLDGAWYDGESGIEADKAIFDVRHLDTWVDTNGLDTKWPMYEGEPDGPYAVVTANRRSPYVTDHEGLAVNLVHILEHKGDQETSSGIEQTWRLVLGREPMGNLEEFTDVAMDIRALVTIAAGKNAEIERVVIQHPALHGTSVSGKPIPRLRENVAYYSRWAHTSDDVALVGTHDLYFTLAQFGGAATLGRWLTTAKQYPTELRRVMATRYTNVMYLEDRIMNTCAALESFDVVRRHVPMNKCTFAKRITECVELAGSEFNALIVEPVEPWVERVVSARNHLAHHGNQFRTNGTVGERLLAEQLYWLFVLCLLRLTEAGTATFENIRGHREIRWLIEQAQAPISYPKPAGEGREA